MHCYPQGFMWTSEKQVIGEASCHVPNELNGNSGIK